MKKLILLFIAFLFMQYTLNIYNCEAQQWVQMSNGMGNDRWVYSLASNGNYLFAGVRDSCVYRSTNNGTSWTKTYLYNTIPMSVYSLATLGNYVFAGTEYSVYRSTNNGTNWSSSLGRLALSFLILGNNIFAGTQDSGIYRSTNNGDSWTKVGLNGKSVFCFTTLGNNIFAGSKNPGIYISTDNGTSWAIISGILNNKTVYSLTSNGNYLYAGTQDYPLGNGNVYISTNNGSSWTPSTLTNYTIESLVTNGSNIFCSDGEGGGVLTSINNGLSWSQINQGLYPYPSVDELLIQNNYLYAATYESVWRIDLSVLPSQPTLISPANNSTENLLNLNLVWNKSQYAIAYNLVLATDMSFTNIVLDTILSDTTKSIINLNPISNYYWKVRTKNISIWGAFSNIYTFRTCSPWYPIYNGITNNDVNTFTANGSNIFAGTMGGVFLSSNNGLNWTSISNGLTSLNVKSLIFNGSNLFAGTEGGGIYLSANNGGFWIAVNSGLYSQSITSLITSGSNIFAGTTSGVYRSTNNGGNWISAGLSFTGINSLYLNGSTIYAGTSGGLYYTNNNGSNWNSTFGTMNVKSITISGTYLFIGTTAGVFLSTNNGSNWIASWLTNQNINTLIINGSRIFAGTDTGGVFLSTNNGINWLQKNQGFNTTPSVRSFLISNNFIFAGTYGQTVWNRDLTYIIGIKTISDIVPSSYSLGQNYPNPFNPRTNIKFDVTRSGYVKIIVYDVMGREVETLVNERLQPGTYQVDWDGSSFASGVYYYKLITDKFIETKRMVLIK